MTFVITSACIDVMDKSCIEVCPVDCIHFEAEDRMCYIDPETCIDCDACEAACPVGAIFGDAEVPREVEHFSELNARWFDTSQRQTVRQAIADIGDGTSALT